MKAKVSYIMARNVVFLALDRKRDLEKKRARVSRHIAITQKQKFGKQLKLKCIDNSIAKADEVEAYFLKIIEGFKEKDKSHTELLRRTIDICRRKEEELFRKEFEK